MAKGKYEKWLTKDGLILLEGWARNGLVDEQIAHNMGINVATLYQYKNKYSDICNALKKGKEVVDLEVENALLKRALGYEYEERVIDDKGEKTIIKHLPPDTTAQIFWLKNRKPADWRDKRETELYGKDGGAINIAPLNTTQIDERIKELQSKVKID